MSALAKLDKLIGADLAKDELDALVQARAAFAELVEAAQDYRDARDFWHSDDTLLRLAASYSDSDMPSLAEILKATDTRLVSALARMRGRHDTPSGHAVGCVEHPPGHASACSCGAGVQGGAA